MSVNVCISPSKGLDYLNGGGALWIYLNWALGLRALGCRVIWMEGVSSHAPAGEVRAGVATLKGYLEPHGLAGGVALYSTDGEPLPAELADVSLSLEDAADAADLLLNLRYDMRREVVNRFRRSALVDIDPGLLQVWLSAGLIGVARHDCYFTIGETVGRPGALFPDCGLKWFYTPPPVALDAWPPSAAADESAHYTTVSQWRGEYIEIQGESFDNSKRASFMDYVELPARTRAKLELALCLGRNEAEERRHLERKGWKIRSAWDEIPTPEQYRAYVAASRGEFSCATPSCMRLQNAWISDRTLCYLASAKPAVVQHTGESRFLPDGEGLFRFRSPEEAARALAAAESDYEHHCRAARAVAEEYFDAAKVVGRVLERALD